MTYPEAVMWKAVLLDLLNDNFFEPGVWRRIIGEMQESGFPAMAGDLQKRYEHYVNRLAMVEE